MRILALALGVPFPPIGGGLTRTHQLLKALADEHDVTLAAFTYGERHGRPPFTVRVEAVPWEWSAAYREMTGPDPDASRRAWQHLTFETQEPWFASVMETARMDELLARLLRDAPDLVLLEGTPLARFLPALSPDLPCVLDFFDVHSVMTQQATASTSDPAEAFEAKRTLAFERRAVERCGTCLTVSEQDAAAVRALFGATDVHVVPNGVDTSYFTPSSAATEAGALLFTGRMSYGPNADAAMFFARDVLPIVRGECPNARFHIVGAAPPPEVMALASDSVVVHGRVDDIRPFFAQSEVVVAPIRSGGGTRLKVLEAAASAKAIVSTPLGVAGLAFEHNRDLLVAGAVEEFAAAIVSLLRDADRRRRLGANALAASRLYHWSAIGNTLRRILAGRIHTPK